MTTEYIEMETGQNHSKYNKAEILLKLFALEFGERLTYYRGYLAKERKKWDNVRAIAKAALRASDEARVHLVQKRHGDEDYEYIAVGAKKKLNGNGNGGHRDRSPAPSLTE